MAYQKWGGNGTHWNGNSGLPKGSELSTRKANWESSTKARTQNKQTANRGQRLELPPPTHVHREVEADWDHAQGHGCGCLLTLQALAILSPTLVSIFRGSTPYVRPACWQRVRRKALWQCLLVIAVHDSWATVTALSLKVHFCDMEKCKRRLLITHN